MTGKIIDHQYASLPEQIRAKVDHVEMIMDDKFPWWDSCDCWIAGGYLRDVLSRNKKRSDIDLFFSSQEGYDKFTSYLKETDLIFENSFVTKYRINNQTVDLVKKIYKSPKECIDSFDFTVSCVAIDLSLRLYHHINYWQDLASRSLVIHCLPNPTSTLRRLQKYILKGYKICNGGIITLASEIYNMETDPKGTDPDTLYID